MKTFEGSSRCDANNEPKALSVVGFVFQTRMGPSGGKSAGANFLDSMWKMYGRCISRLCSASSVLEDMSSNRPVDRSVAMVS